MDSQTPLTDTGFQPSEREVQDLLGWFARYDEHVRNGDVEAMADMALVPIVVMSHDSAGDAVVQEWDRDMLVQSLGMNADADMSEIEIDNRREPVFLSSDLAVVVTDSTVTSGGQQQHMRYVDVMVRQGRQWGYKAMIQAGWGDMLKEYFGA